MPDQYFQGTPGRGGPLSDCRGPQRFINTCDDSAAASTSGAAPASPAISARVDRRQESRLSMKDMDTIPINLIAGASSYGNNAAWMCRCDYPLPLIGTTRPGQTDRDCPACGAVYRVIGEKNSNPTRVEQIKVGSRNPATASGRGCVKRDVLGGSSGPAVLCGSSTAAPRAVNSREAEEVLRIGSAAAAVMRRLPDCGGGP